jgi:hypothetical protein
MIITIAKILTVRRVSWEQEWREAVEAVEAVDAVGAVE